METMMDCTISTSRVEPGLRMLSPRAKPMERSGRVVNVIAGHRFFWSKYHKGPTSSLSNLLRRLELNRA
jgi:hypothetical protein